MTEKEALSEIPGMIALNCPHCGAAKLVRRMQIDPPQARLAFYPCCKFCADHVSIDEVIYTDRARNPISL